MKRKILLALFTLVMILSACDNNQQTTPGDKNDNIFVEFTTETMNIFSFETKKLPLNTNANLNEVKVKSSDSSIVEINNHKIIPLSEGKATITATLPNGKTDTFVVIVSEDGNVPYLSTISTISLFEGTEYKLDSKVTLRGKEVDVTYRYHSNDESVATIDVDGKITAKKAGTTDISIIANYNGYDGYIYSSLKRTVKVTVNPVVVLTIDSDDTVLNTRNDIVNGVEYANSSALEGEALIDGEYQNIFDLECNWISSNSEVARVESGRIVAFQSGKAQINAEININNIVYKSNCLDIIVEKPMIKIEGLSVDIDLFDNNLNLPVDYMIGSDNTIINITDKENRDVIINEGNKLVDYNNLGPRTWVIESTNYNYELNVVVCSKIITTKEEMGLLHTYAKNVVKGSNGISSFEGYFILENDIDMRSTRFRTFCGIGTGATSVVYNGFIGVFDGRGYTIKNAAVASSGGGLFGTFNRKSIIKDVSFINANVSGDSGLISSNFGGTIDNVYVEGKLTCTRASAVSPSSLLVSKIYDGAKIKNCIVKISNPSVNNNYCSAIGMLVTAKEDAFTNVFVLGTDFKVFSTTVGDKYNILLKECNGQFNNYSDLLKNDLSSFNDFWLFGESEIIFSTSH